MVVVIKKPRRMARRSVWASKWDSPLADLGDRSALGFLREQASGGVSIGQIRAALAEAGFKISEGALYRKAWKEKISVHRELVGRRKSPANRPTPNSDPECLAIIARIDSGTEGELLEHIEDNQCHGITGRDSKGRHLYCGEKEKKEDRQKAPRRRGPYYCDKHRSGLRQPSEIKEKLGGTIDNQSTY